MTTPQIKQIDQNTYEVVLRVSAKSTLLETEESLHDKLNKAACLALEQMIPRFDADGAPIRIGENRYTSKGRSEHNYETVHGTVRVKRHVYPSQHGGKTFCPLEDQCRMVLNATPRLAKVVAAKYADMGATALVKDMKESNRHAVSVRYAKALGDFIGAVVEAKEAYWEYDLPALSVPVASVSVGLDGTCMLMKGRGWRQAMCGSISLYDAAGERLFTLYAGAAPEYGKAKFHERFERELQRVKERFPKALYIGLADGAADNWSWLAGRTDRQVVDFWHAREYVGKAARAIHGSGTEEQASWESEWSHRLKHERGVVTRLISEMGRHVAGAKGLDGEDLSAAIRYFENHKSLMGYSRHVKERWPIGSGVTEAACKTLVKARMCQSGMRWKDEGASCVISLRAIRMGGERWEQFWEKIARYGF